MNPHYSRALADHYLFSCENLPISGSGIRRWESRASGTPPFFHQINKEIDFSSAMLAKPPARFWFLLCMTRIGGWKKVLRDQLCPLQLLKGCLPRGLKGEADHAKADGMIISQSHVESVGRSCLSQPLISLQLSALLRLSSIRQKPEGLNSPCNGWNRSYSWAKAYPAEGHSFCDICEAKQSECSTQDDFFSLCAPLGWSFERIRITPWTESCFWADRCIAVCAPFAPSASPKRGGDMWEPENPGSPVLWEIFHLQRQGHLYNHLALMAPQAWLCQ